MDFLLDSIGELLFGLLATAFGESWGSAGPDESKCRIQTLFGNDVWWNSK
jgi:hypothetical protein